MKIVWANEDYTEIILQRGVFKKRRALVLKSGCEYCTKAGCTMLGYDQVHTTWKYGTGSQCSKSLNCWLHHVIIRQRKKQAALVARQAEIEAWSSPPVAKIHRENVRPRAITAALDNIDVSV